MRPLVSTLAIAGTLATLALSRPAAADCTAKTRAYVGLEKGLYVWDHDVSSTFRARIVETVRAHHFTEIYVYVGATQWDWTDSYAKGLLPAEDALAALTTALRDAGAHVHGLYYLNDDPNDFSNAARVDDLVDAAKGFATRYPAGRLDGLQGDQEPGNTAVYADELAATKRATTRAAGALTIDATVRPRWLRDVGPSGRLFFEELVDVLPVATLMDYTNVDSTARAMGDQILAYADGTKTKVAIAIETGSTGAAPEETWNALVKSDPEAFRAEVVALDTAFRAHASFRHIVVHDFAQYFAALYGAAPATATTPVPMLCDAIPGGDADVGDAAADAAGDGAGSEAADAGTLVDAAFGSDAAIAGDTATGADGASEPATPTTVSTSGGCGMGRSDGRGDDRASTIGAVAMLLLVWARRRRSDTER